MGYARLSVPLALWPDLDRQLWMQANQPGDFLESGGRAAEWTAKTRRQVEKDYGRLLSWLAETDNLDVHEMPGARLSQTRLEGYLAHLQATGMAPTSLLSRMRGILQAILALDPTADAVLGLLRRLCARLKRLAIPQRQKHLRMVDPAVLVDAALAEYDRLAQSGAPMPIRACNHARDALILAFLVHHPIRLGNFTSLRIGHEIVFADRDARLTLNASQTKEHRPYEATVAGELIPYIRHYLEDVRPLLLRGAAIEQLWVSMRGGPMSESTIYYQMIKITKRLVDRPINPHLVRDIAMTNLVEQAPERARAGGALLAHADMRTGEQHYNHADVASAQTAYFETIRNIRRRAGGRKRG